MFEEWSANLVNWNHPPPAGLTRERVGDRIFLTAPWPAAAMFFRCRLVVPQ